MQKSCRQCSVSFEITQNDLAFYDKVSPVFNGVKYQLPEPTLCPDCRQQRRLVWRNERKLYKRNCDHCKKEMVSIYSQNVAFPVFCQKCWWSDSWDSTSFGRDFDFSKTFFQQFSALFQSMPKINMIGANNENSDFCNLTANCRNCYLVHESSNNEDSLYGYWLQKCKDCFDSAFLHECEQCYECQNCYNCYNSKYLSDCKNCSDSWFLKNCIGCKNCFGSVNLRNKEYYFFNTPCSKEDYIKKITEFSLEKNPQIEGFKKQFSEYLKQFVYKYAKIESSDNCSGDFIEHSKNCNTCFHAHDAENCSYAEHVWRNAKNIMDASTAGRDAELMYEVLNCAVSAYDIRFASQCWESSFLNYCVNCHVVSNCFGCTGLHNHEKYCILNKQYTKEEYEKLVPQIIEHMKKNGEWGEFFPVQLSPFAYNETVAQEYFPLSKEQVLAQGWKWKDENDEIPQVTKIISGERLPDSIKDIPDDVLNWAIKCEVTGRPFKIQKAELAFYRKMNLPIPRKHPDQRHKERLALRNPRKLWHRNCGSCGKGIETTYAPKRPEKVLCEECYLKAVY